MLTKRLRLEYGQPRGTDLIDNTFVFSLQSFSGTLGMKPGLWKVELIITADGKKTNMMAEIEKAIGKMPKAQREQILASMTKHLPQKNLNQVCITKEMVEKLEKMKLEKMSDALTRWIK